MTAPLTPRQHELLGFLRSYQASEGYAPTLQEMADRMGLKTRAGALRLLRCLERKQYVRCGPKRIRAIEILQMARARV
jgi:repressor LexA